MVLFTLVFFRFNYLILIKIQKLKMTKIAVFPGSFDPFTIGHKEIVNKIFPIFDKIIVKNYKKKNKRYFVER